jgi:sirohydrochlorin ferrochelatase
MLACGSMPLQAAVQTVPISQALEALDSVHALAEVAISPNGKQLVYGTEVTGMRGGKQAVVSALFLADARNGSQVRRLTP